MYFIKSRLRQLEKHMGGLCQKCGLRPRDNGYIVIDDNDPAGHIPGVCPECGRSTKIYIRAVYEGEEGEGVAVERQM